MLAGPENRFHFDGWYNKIIGDARGGSEVTRRGGTWPGDYMGNTG